MVDTSNFRDRYARLIRRHLGRDPRPADGFSDAAVTKCEHRLGVRPPLAMREYYLIAGRIDELNNAHNQLFALDKLRIDDGHLWFMEENQAVVHWGLPAKRLSSDDPIVYQRVNEAHAKWHSQKMRFSAFLIRMYDWQAGFVDAPER